MNHAARTAPRLAAMGLAAVALAAGCTHRVEVAPIEVKPIHLTLDITLRVDRELEDFFAFEEEFQPEALEEDRPPAAPATLPAPDDGGAR